MLSPRSLLMIAALSAPLLSGCQTVSSTVGTLVPTGKSIKGEVQWDFAAIDGDIVTIEFGDARGVMVAEELLPTPGAKHLVFELVPAKAELTRCRAGGSCRYSAKLLRGEITKAEGEIYYTPTNSPIVPLVTAGSESIVQTALPKPVYR